MKRKKYFIDNSYLNWLFKFMIASLYGLLSALGINLFLNSAHSYSIGIPGIAQLLNGILVMSHIDLSIATLIILLNIPLVIFSWFIFGSSYTFFSLVAVISNVLFLHLIPETSVITERLTNTLVGSVIIGIGIGFCFRSGFSTGGTDVIVSFIQQKFHRNIGFVNTIINTVVLGFTAIFFGISGATYSLIGMVITSFIMDKIYIQQNDVTLVVLTKKSESIIESLHDYTHGATLFSGKGIYTNQKTDMLVMIIQKSDISFLKHVILLVDKNAFINVQTTEVLNGNYIRRF
ncbi:YitT family protein [Lactobacillus sp. UCMA15818]|uniref:YitT family protein n=2 Tax=Lactobacillales TaxID=186826 RepID=UPI0025AFEE00|nr:YitT family protein [Lactobacillus sp. UCMA15818]MDN2453238.1 YitT family protein [Lactobacillus sp. UCMA15818]